MGVDASPPTGLRTDWLPHRCSRASASRRPRRGPTAHLRKGSTATSSRRERRSTSPRARVTYAFLSRTARRGRSASSARPRTSTCPGILGMTSFVFVAEETCSGGSGRDESSRSCWTQCPSVRDESTSGDSASNVVCVRISRNRHTVAAIDAAARDIARTRASARTGSRATSTIAGVPRRRPAPRLLVRLRRFRICYSAPLEATRFDARRSI